jgi:hypothetical protein
LDFVTRRRFLTTATLLASAAPLANTAQMNDPAFMDELQFANSLGIGHHRPDLVVRFGHGPEMPRSLRRPVGAVIVS